MDRFAAQYLTLISWERCYFHCQLRTDIYMCVLMLTLCTEPRFTADKARVRPIFHFPVNLQERDL